MCIGIPESTYSLIVLNSYSNFATCSISESNYCLGQIVWLYASALAIEVMAFICCEYVIRSWGLV